MTFTQLARRVRDHLAQDHRYEHTVRVARCADILAQRHGLDARRARLAGMLHDLARLYPAQRLLTECEARGMPIDGFERANPVVLHARLGAAIAAETFGVHDEQVLSAIEKHTTAAAAMSPLDCVVFLADGLEPERNFPERAALWELAMNDLTEATREVIKSSVRHLAHKGLAVAPATIAAAHTFGIPLEEVRASTM
ncbi:MAG TPA: bis(5'-nucleosyl)-tetraphosphatase (symmetrical) YqeK [Candidatus Baltobacteraceae bacterium]